MNILVHQIITTESLLFHDAFATDLDCPGGVFRRARP